MGGDYIKGIYERHGTSGVALPSNTFDLEALVRYCAGRLREDSHQARLVLRDIDFSISGRVLFPILGDRKKRNHVMELVLGNGVDPDGIDELTEEFKWDPVIMRYINKLKQVIVGSPYTKVSDNSILIQLYHKSLYGDERFMVLRRAEESVVGALERAGLDPVFSFSRNGRLPKYFEFRLGELLVYVERDYEKKTGREWFYTEEGNKVIDGIWMTIHLPELEKEGLRNLQRSLKKERYRKIGQRFKGTA